MKAKVVKEFVDVETRELRRVGEVFECTEKRYAQIQSKGNYVEKQEKPNKKG